MKAVVVIDMPNEAKIEEYRITYVVYDLKGCGKGVQGVGVSLKPLPEKKEIDKTLKFGGYENTIQEALARGYNAYYDEIVGEINEKDLL